MSQYNETIANRLMQDLTADFGLTRDQASGIVGNLAHESGGFRTLQERRPLVENSRGGWGYAQWTGPRRRNFEAFAESQGLDPSSYEANYGFLAHELSNDYGYSLDEVRSTNTPHDAAEAFSNHYEYPHPDHAHLGRRRSLARDIYLNPNTGFVAPTPTPRSDIQRQSTADAYTDFSDSMKGSGSLGLDGRSSSQPLGKRENFPREGGLQQVPTQQPSSSQRAALEASNPRRAILEFIVNGRRKRRGPR